MNVNNLCLQSIKEIQGRNYVIEKYQRRYRWKTEQVEKLLDDILAFSKGSSNNAFYCLQPVVMHRYNAKSKADYLLKLNEIEEEQFFEKAIEYLQDNSNWEIVDGQQRLTTISLILKCLNQDYINIKTITRNEEDNLGSNLDNVFKKRNKGVIDGWIKDNLGSDNEKRNHFVQIILNRVKVIWYEINENPEDVYKRLNTGKIPLTDAELIKALLLCSRQNDSLDNNEIGIIQSEIANEWNNIEYKLQDDNLFFFLFSTESNTSRMDSLCRIIYEHQLLDLAEKESNVQYSSYPVFNYISDKITKQNIITIRDMKKYLWDDMIMELFNTFLEWYNDVELYHYIGYLIATNKKCLGELYRDWITQKSKTCFITEIKGFIYGSICNRVNDEPKEKTSCRDILLFHNIQTAIQMNRVGVCNSTGNNGFNYRFPFDSFKKERWDVEHIEPETECDFSNPEDQKWYRRCFPEPSIKNLDLSDNNNSDNDSNISFNEFREKHPYHIDLDENEKNSLKNYVLLDSKTNRSYKNAIFPVKRMIIAQKDLGLTEENNLTTPFIPPCTRNVFMKYYSSLYLEPTVWTKTDAENYLQDIKRMVDKINPENKEKK